MEPQVFYQCQRCGNCCRWPGFVRLTGEDTIRLAGRLGLDPGVFTAEYTELHPNRQGLVLKNQPDGACIFLDGRNVCRVQDVKPWQCRGFPNDWNFPGWQKVCEAVPVAHSGLPS
ncbi:MAG: YkgJ family cysteine cluster protein [Candidatus Methylacidiphilales bacterium]|nr:YkgJ family cysteine cluster protein [Candidatus Methylacidiphilales bacterium]